MTAARRIAVLALLAGLFLGMRWLWVATSVGAGFAAKVTCSLVFVSGQPARQVLDDYVLREISPLGPALGVEVEGRQVVSRVLGWTRARAVHRPGLGCTQVYGGGEPAPVALPARRTLDPSRPWPRGGAAAPGPPPAAVQAAIDRAFAEPGAPEGYRRQTRAIVVAHRGRLVAERYAPGYGPETPMLSWSMAKSVLATLVGLAADAGRLDLQAPAPVPEWRGDRRAAITLDQLLRMSSGLRFDERYGPTTDASVMLFTRPDVASFAAAMPLDAEPDRVWSYSSGTTNVVSRILRDAFDADAAALARFAHEELFDPADITSARLEVDASGTPIGSSFVFMTARDWARFGELHRRGGSWDGRRVLPEGWVEYVTTPTPTAPRGNYGAHWWLNAGRPDDPDPLPWPGLPADLFAARGHNGQYLVVVPSAELVVVRLGLSLPSKREDQHGVSALVAGLIDFYGEDGASARASEGNVVVAGRRRLVEGRRGDAGRVASALQRPHVQAVEVLDLAPGTLPLAPAQAELDANLVADAVAVQLLAAVAGELEEHVLGITGIVAQLDDELALAKALGDLLRVEDGVDSSGGFQSHGRRGYVSGGAASAQSASASSSASSTSP